MSSSVSFAPIHFVFVHWKIKSIFSCEEGALNCMQDVCLLICLSVSTSKKNPFYLSPWKCQHLNQSKKSYNHSFMSCSQEPSKCLLGYLRSPWHMRRLPRRGRGPRPTCALICSYWTEPHSWSRKGHTPAWRPHRRQLPRWAGSLRGGCWPPCPWWCRGGSQSSDRWCSTDSSSPREQSSMLANCLKGQALTHSSPHFVCTWY